MKYMGIDYGAKHIGVAFSDEDGRIAFPYAIVKQSNNAIRELAALAKKEGVGEIIIGESLDMFGKPNKIMDKIAPFSMAFGKVTGLPISFEKEFLTSHHATRQKGKSALHDRQIKMKSGVPIDASAAALIMQRYLDKKNRARSK